MAINLFEYALKAFLVIGVIFYVPISSSVGNVNAVEFGYFSQELFFRYGIMVLFCLAQMRQPVRTLKMNSIPLLVIFVIIASLFQGFTNTARHSILNMFCWFVLYKTIYEHFYFARLKSFSWWLGWLLFLNLAVCALQYNGHDLLYTHVDGSIPGLMDRIMGLMKLKVHLGILAAILFPLVVYFVPVFSICVIPLFYFGVSSVAVMSAVISSLIMAWLFLKKRLAALITILVLLSGVAFVVLYDMPGGQFGERFKVWGATASVTLKTNPVIGSGIGAFKNLNIVTKQKNGEFIPWSWAHNEFIQAFYEIGILGLAIVVGFLVKRYQEFETFYYDSVLKVLFCVCLSIVIISIFHFPFHLARFAHLIAFFFAIYHARVEDLRHA